MIPAKKVSPVNSVHRRVLFLHHIRRLGIKIFILVHTHTHTHPHTYIYTHTYLGVICLTKSVMTQNNTEGTRTFDTNKS